MEQDHPHMWPVGSTYSYPRLVGYSHSYHSMHRFYNTKLLLTDCKLGSGEGFKWYKSSTTIEYSSWTICLNWTNDACFIYNINVWKHVDGLTQDCSNSIGNALELLQSCTKPLMWYFECSIWHKSRSPGITPDLSDINLRPAGSTHSWYIYWSNNAKYLFITDCKAGSGDGFSLYISSRVIQYSSWSIHINRENGRRFIYNYSSENVIHWIYIQYIPRNMHTVFALLCFVVVIHWLMFPYPLGLLHWHRGNLTIAPVPAKQPWWIWINTSCEFIINDCMTTTKQSTTKPCAYFLGYTVCKNLDLLG